MIHLDNLAWQFHKIPLSTNVSIFFPVNIVPDVEPANYGSTGQGGAVKGPVCISSSRSIPIPGALFHHTRNILLIV